MNTYLLIYLAVAALVFIALLVTISKKGEALGLALIAYTALVWPYAIAGSIVAVAVSLLKRKAV